MRLRVAERFRRDHVRLEVHPAHVEVRPDERREGVEAEQIAHLVFQSFKQFRPVLQKFGFFSIKSLNIGAETLVEQEGADDRTTIVPVYVSAMIQDRWVLREDAARELKQIIVEHLFEASK